MSKATNKKSDEHVESVEKTQEEFLVDKPATIDIVEDEVETELQFLKRLLRIQHEGDWGKHLDSTIEERIKLLK